MTPPAEEPQTAAGVDEEPPPVIVAGEAQVELSRLLDAHVTTYRRLEAFAAACARALDLTAGRQ